MPDGLRLALTTLTVLPVRGPASLDRPTASRAMLLAPLVGLLLGALLLPVVLLVDDPLLTAALVLAGLALLTRGLHLDGLADLGDGLGSARDPEGAREVMKAPDVGALGLAAVVLVLLVQAAALAACVAAGRGLTAVLLAAVTGRLAVTAACTRGVPAATPTGLGALVAGTVPGAVAPVGALVTASLGGTALLLEDDAVLPAVLAVVLGLGAALLLLRHAVRRVGGVTGDVLGALVEVTTAVVLVVVAVS